MHVFLEFRKLFHYISTEFSDSIFSSPLNVKTQLDYNIFFLFILLSQCLNVGIKKIFFCVTSVINFFDKMKQLKDLPSLIPFLAGIVIFQVSPCIRPHIKPIGMVKYGFL